MRPLIPVASIVSYALLSIASAPAQAATARKIDVPAGRLGDSIIALSAQTGVNIGIRDQRLVNLRVGAVHGRMTVEAALRKMLRGQSAKAIAAGSNGWVIIFVQPKQKPAPKPPHVRPVQKPQPVTRPQPIDEKPLPQPVEIVVTATKRHSSVDHLPVSVTVIGGEAFLPTPDGANGAALSAQAVSVTSTHFGSGRNKLFVRGIADSGFSGPTQATVGQYLGEARINYNAPDPDLRLHDIKAVEILEGPQGTLYGSGSLGGIVRTVPNSPRYNETEGRVIAATTLTQSGAPGFETVGILNIPLAADKAALRANIYRAREGGYIDDALRGQKDINRSDILGGRAALGVNLTDSWKLELLGLFQKIDLQDAQYADHQQMDLSRQSAIAQPFGQRYAMGTASVNGDVGRVNIVGSFGYVSNRSIETFDATADPARPAGFDQAVRTGIWSGELRAHLDFADNNFILAGISFLNSRSSTARRLEFGDDVTFNSLLDSRLQEWTLFGEGAFRLSDRLQATVGGRVSSIAFSGRKFDMLDGILEEPMQAFASRRQTIAAPSAALLFDLNSTTKAFLRLQQGYRPGGLALEFGTAFRFQSDRITTAEFGMRFGHPNSSTVSGSFSLSHSRWNDIQADIADAIGLPVTINIGNGDISTLQTAVQFRPTGKLTVDASALYNRSRLSEPSLRLLSADTRAIVATGRSTLPNVADWNARLSARYSDSLNDRWNWDVIGALRYIGRSRLGLGDRFDKMQGGNLQSNLLVRLRNDGFAVYISGANLFNDKASRFGVGNPFAPDISNQFVPQRPRSVTLGFDWSY